ncbi:putative transcription factor C3H family [Lupinus albus]|uniref:Putative transcription factor C3H family n=1 Tax=Lupinus albus TaxID=3870 RepID=A0A6A4R2K1_LUPAL|nr:putative transcription factor C3H family [Lupinus albus]
MDTIHEATNVVITRINNLAEPENASKIIGYILVNFHDIELIRLASSPDHVLHSLVLRLKTLMGLSSSALSSPNPIHVPMPRPRLISANPFSRFTGNHPSLPSFTNNPIIPKFGSFVSPDHGSISKSRLSPRVIMGGERDFNEQQMRDYFSFLKDVDLVDPKQLELSHGDGDAHFHRNYSTGDVCVGSEQIGFKPCFYFAEGFCRNGRNCKFLHGDLNNSVGPSVGSATRFEGLEQGEEFMRLDAAQQQRLMVMAATASLSSHDKYIHFLMQRQNDSQRAEFYKFGRCSSERNEFLAMLAAGKQNPSSRQIYLTFPSESTFKDQDVSEYFR